MRRSRGWLTLMGLASYLAPSQYVFAQNPPTSNIRVVQKADWVGQPKYRQDQLLVRFRPGTQVPIMQAAHAALAAQIVKSWDSVEGLELVQLPAGTNLQNAIATYRRNSNVLYAEPNFIVHALETPNDPLFVQQWNFQSTGQLGGLPGADIHAAQAWTQTTGSSSVVVAVIDTGIDYNHPDLANNVWTNTSGFSGTLNGVSVNCAAGTHGLNVVASTCDPLDDNGHGTHVSGTIGAVGNNEIGVTGVNWAVQIMPCKFLDASGSGAVGDAVTCLDFVKAMKDLGVNVVASSNSWGGGDFSQALGDAIQAQQRDGILFIAAAGNDFEDNDIVPIYPASYFYPNVISVAATDRLDDLAYFSDYGLHTVFLGAPGQEILSTTPNNTYTVLNGTSMATPHVAGVAALLAAFNSMLDWRAIKNLILAGGDTLPALSATVTGKRLNAYGALTCANTIVSNRLLPAVDSITGTIGQPITLAALNINCSQPAGPVVVTVSPGGQTISLVDDGSGDDQAAGDGVYTAHWTPTGMGTYMLNFPSGDPVQVTVLSNYTVGESNSPYVTISGTNLNLADDDVATIASPFPILFGGGNFTSLYVSSNGTISFTNPFGDYINLSLPRSLSHFDIPISPPPPIEDQPVVTLLAPYWQDLYPLKGSNQNVFWGVTGAEPNRQFVVEWRNVRTYDCLNDPSANVTFEVVFSEGSSNVAFNYSNVVFGGTCSNQDYGNSATVGIQINQDVGIQWSYDQSTLNNGMSLLWSIAPTNPTLNPAPIVTSVSPASLPSRETDQIVMLTGTGFVPGSQVLDFPTTYISSTQLQVLIPAAEPAFAAVGGVISLQVTNPAPGGGTDTFALAVIGLAPQITSISQTSVPAGSFGFLMTINGSGFYQYSDSVWNGPTGQSVVSGAPDGGLVFVSPNQIIVPIPDFLLTEPGTATIQIENAGNGNGVGNVFSNAVQFTITPGTNPAPSNPSSSGGATPGTAGQRPKPAPRIPPVKFMGWNYAHKVGGAYLDRLLAERTPSGPFHAADINRPTQIQSTTSTPPAAGFNFRPTLPAGSIPTAVVTGDFNGDGKLDWAVANGGDNSIWIYLGNGDATSQLPIIAPLRGLGPAALVAADMNHDGKLDLVVAEADSIMVAVLLGNGDGTFQPELQFAAPNPPVSLAVADFDGDGNLDVVAGIVNTETTGRLAFFYGDGTGKLNYPVFRDEGAGLIYFIPVSIAAADLNGDGLPDIVSLNLGVYGLDGESYEDQGATAGVLAYLNRGDGVFKLFQEVYTDNSNPVYQSLGLSVAATALALGDVNNDGCIDAVIFDTGGNATYFPGLCDGTFDSTNSRVFGTGIVAGAASLADLNNDGKLDLVSSGIAYADSTESQTSDGNSISVQLGDGTGNFSSPTTFRGESGMFSVAVGDLANNGNGDIITANQLSDSVSVYVNNGQGAFGGPSGGYLGYLTAGQPNLIPDTASEFFAAVDVNGDGNKDLVTLQIGSQYPLPTSLTVLPGDGTGKFGAPLRSPILASSVCGVPCIDLRDIAFEDVRNVGVRDSLILAATNGATPSRYLAEAKNNGDGTFQIPTITSLPNIASNLLIPGDFNGDGKLDVVLLQSSGQPSGLGENVGIVPMLGNGDGTFTQGTITGFGSSTSNLGSYIFTGQAADINHDGKLDLLILGDALVSPTDQNALYELIGNGDGTFQPPKLLFNNFSSFFSVVDLNHDGQPDIVEAVRGLLDRDLLVYPWTYQVLLGQSDGTFQPGMSYGPYYLPLAFGFFAGTTDKPLQPAQPLLGDFNGDGNVDIAVYTSGVAITPAYFGSIGASTPTSLQILLGNGDGTFTPSGIVNSLGRFAAPSLAVDVNGDGRSDLVEVNGYTSSYDVILATPTPTFLPSLEAVPVVGSNGKIRIVLDSPNSIPTVFQISSSDPKIVISSTATIAAGSSSVEESFVIGNGFNAGKLFAFTVTSGSESHTIYGTQAQPANNVGFSAQMSTATPVVLPSQSTNDYGVVLISTGGYSTTVQFSCLGLPAGASCQFGANQLALAPDEEIENDLIVNTQSNIPVGAYTFTAVITDGFLTINVPGSFNVGDFTMSVAPTTRTIGTTDYTNYSLFVEGLQGFKAAVQVTCSGFPTGMPCPANLSGAPNPDGAYFQIVSQNAAPGDYTLTFTGVSGPIIRSASAQLIITSGAFTGSVSSTSATISVGSSQNFNVHLASVSGFQGRVALSCTALQGIACQFAPSQVSVTPTVPGSSVLTVSVTAIPTMAFPLGNRKKHDPPNFFVPMLVGTIVAASMVIAFFLQPECRLKKRRVRLAGSILLIFLIVSIAGLSSCGGTGGFASPSGGNGGGSGGGGGSGFTSQVTVQGSVGGTTVALGTISVTVP